LFSLIWFQAVPGSAADEAKPEGAKVVVPDVTEEDAAKLEKLQGLIRKKAEADRDEAKEQKVAAEKAILEGGEGEAKNKPAEDQEPDPAEMQGMEYFRRFSRCEVYLIHKCCELTPEQIKQLSDAGEKEIQRLFAVRRGRNHRIPHPSRRTESANRQTAEPRRTGDSRTGESEPLFPGCYDQPTRSHSIQNPVAPSSGPNEDRGDLAETHPRASEPNRFTGRSVANVPFPLYGETSG